MIMSTGDTNYSINFVKLEMNNDSTVVSRVSTTGLKMGYNYDNHWTNLGFSGLFNHSIR